ncbi:uncharacterized protein P884DRAFT_297013 [Thermothelomyces heterothallicus CBS 202.75]|uniref:uncharacterized protein n=1 Tax=Thermothelomyces heterothallicus CBS 202.75 TaxID=1149848 RepID=UPI0037449FBE
MAGFPKLIPAFKAVPGGGNVRLDVQSTARDAAQGLPPALDIGSKELAALEDKVYVGSGRFVFEPGKPAIVEYKVSEVVA